MTYLEGAFHSHADAGCKESYRLGNVARTSLLEGYYCDL